MQTTLRLQSLPFGNVRTYLAAFIFILGNILVPQIFHLIHQGGPTWLPIYFFTLVGAYMYGWRVGLLTALVSPVLSAAIFGMPAISALPAIMLKSSLLALVAGFAAARFNKVSLLILFGVVLSYQVLGTLGEWAIKGDFHLACQDFRLGIPGMLLQIVGGWAVIKFLIRK